MTAFATKVTDTGWGQSPSVVSGTFAPQKKVRTRQTGTAWTRSGCLTCKKRRKGCDKAKPSCNNCIKQGRICEGYGSVWAEPLGPSAQVFKPIESFDSTNPPKSRPKNASSTSLLVSPSLSPLSDARLDAQSSVSISPSASIPSSPRHWSCASDAPQKYDQNEQTTEEAVNSRESLAVVPRPRNYISHLSDHESHYLQYHVQQGSRLLANLESDDNPLRSLLIPRAMSSPLLMRAVCAVSALHLANRSQCFSAQTASATFYGRTLNGIRSVLVESSPEALSDNAMLAVGLLCKYEIVRGSVKQWVVHLNALQRLIATRGGLHSMDPDAAHFLRGLYLYAYNMARISNRKRITAAEPCPADTDLGAPRLDIYIGYTEEILKLCARIAELPSLAGDLVSLRLAIASINGSLLTWSHTSIPYIIPQGLKPASLTRLQLVAECFRDAGFIYLHSILEHMSLRSIEKRASANLYYTEWAPLIFTPKSVAVHRCLARVETFPLDDHCEYSALTFPLFIAGAESDVLAHRRLVVQSLAKLQNNFGIGNVKRAEEVLGILWARKDANALDDIILGEPNINMNAQSAHWLDILEELQWELILA
ncbi:uncharacterized protein N7484_001963 [Penicillium longicatenatum]|uniref:uncharacterized protein n=1 Tax=Penicillium longicatenatum TaxID=1561947 RepID=UPI0025469D46|nr:uncharacterized protein N7484_001963 [Penicillium longicatenatum]KAJ5658314.1 hypothetical protein N7484_001963 [Penicillium longicatenatum]